MTIGGLPEPGTRRPSRDVIEEFEGCARPGLALVQRVQSVVQQRVVVEPLLRLSLSSRPAERFIWSMFDAPPEKILKKLLPRYVEAQIPRSPGGLSLRAGARMTAMEAATKNASR